MPVPEVVRELIERFTLHGDEYRTGRFNETQLRRDFLDPLFEALGWDVSNKAGYAEAYRDVIHEDAIKVGGATKAPDYCFRVGGTRKFFVEAKKPGVNLKNDPVPAYQLRRYGWSAKLPLCILTDFEEFAVYDCRKRPDAKDKASVARTMYLTCTEFADRWDDIAGVFSREAVLKGSFDKYADSSKRKRGTAEVDDAFLAEIEGWRELLARNIALRNSGLGVRDLNYAVQKTIDRLVFLRICEDRGIEDYGRLQALQNGQKVYARLTQLFEAADDRYNSGLFHFHKEKNRAEPPDEWTLSLTIDDKPLKEILKHLYYPDSPYEFSVLPADILGQVYERFLGKVIRLTAGGSAKVEEKPEVRKAGGVYYTPTYIVENTVGKLLDGAKVVQAERRNRRLDRTLRVLDPACGSGSFLLGAYQFLLDWYLNWYRDQNPEKLAATASPPVHFDAKFKDWRLTTAERKRILLDHIYGVDIDAQAVEVTKLSLLLKVLEGETRETLQRQLFAKERALPDLAENIKCGNSLIGPDFYAATDPTLFDDEERLRINVFDWKTEFPAAMKAGGFDAVIGNPPYVRMEMFKEIKDYLRIKYASHADRADLYVYFIEREHDLLRTGGRFGMIVSNKFLRARYGAPVRKRIAEVATVEEIVDFAGLPVFRAATVRTIVLITRKADGDTKSPDTLYSPPLPVETFGQVETRAVALADAIRPLVYHVPADELRTDGWGLLQPEYSRLLERLSDGSKNLKEFIGRDACMGVKSGLTAAFLIDAETRASIVAANPAAKEIIVPHIQGREIRRYDVQANGEYLIYTHHGVPIETYPAVREYLRPFKDRLEARATEQEWYELQQPQFAYAELFRRPKIVFPDMATNCRFALDQDGYFGSNTVYFLPSDDRALLALLNSQLSLFYFRQICAALEGPGEAYLRFFGQYLKGFPVRLDDTKRRAALAELAERQIRSHRGRDAVRSPHQRVAIEREIAALDTQIDALVYELYGLTDAEIAIVESATG